MILIIFQTRHHLASITNQGFDVRRSTFDVRVLQHNILLGNQEQAISKFNTRYNTIQYNTLPIPTVDS